MKDTLVEKDKQYDDFMKRIEDTQTKHNVEINEYEQQITQNALRHQEEKNEMLKNKRELLDQVRGLQREMKELQKVSSQGPGSKKSSVTPVKSQSVLPELVENGTQTEIYMKKMDKALEAVENVTGLKKKLKKRNEEFKALQL